MAIPKYAQGVPRNLLVNYLCKSRCAKMSYGKVSKFSWSKDGSKLDHDLYVTCLKCGGTQRDNYNWINV
jgi:hypothetical protein